ncbi:hypothetical protein ACFX1Z_018351 [Malus domestica]
MLASHDPRLKHALFSSTFESVRLVPSLTPLLYLHPTLCYGFLSVFLLFIVNIHNSTRMCSIAWIEET